MRLPILVDDVVVLVCIVVCEAAVFRAVFVVLISVVVIVGRCCFSFLGVVVVAIIGVVGGVVVCVGVGFAVYFCCFIVFIV